VLARGPAGPPGPLRDNLEEIGRAAQRSAAVTRQLLAFARKQTVAPRVLDLNECVESVLRMIRRLIGEEIDLSWNPGRHLRKVRIDPSQVDQLMANLATNARDAIGGVGRITIETANVALDGGGCLGHAGSSPGEYVVLTVSDDGCGIPRERLKSIFDPFFTTKEPGKGTGLGLATVYGIAKQNDGFVEVDSAPGEGATFRVWFPAAEAADEALPPACPPVPETPGGSETILLVEDEPSSLAMVREMLETFGYRVLASESPSGAIRLAESDPGGIDLLLTDVVMPGMDGRALRDALAGRRPGLRTLFMSGYTSDAIAHRGVLDEGVHFLQKPFSRLELGRKVREVLDGGA
jgi:CheY-like chemotaxis protein